VIDVLGLGCAAIDDLLYVAAYPPADAKTQVLRRDRQGGGLTATALVAASRLGGRAAYAGTLGDDDLSKWLLQRLRDEGVDVAHVRRLPGARPIHSVIIVDEGRQTRTIFYDLADVHGAETDWPAEEVIRSSRVLFVDHFGVEGMGRAARIARAAGVPVVADFERHEMPGFGDLLALVDHVIISRDFGERLTGETDPAAALDRLWTADRRVVVVTCGADGCWYRTAADPAPRHQPAYPVPTVDTTGCGDVFHGAYTAALARAGRGSADLACARRGSPDPAETADRRSPDPDPAEMIRFASAAAALKATRRGGQAGIPTRAAVEAFLKEQRR
jgi:sugar/nucleoside kinase (ribokinase family)